MIGRGSRDQSNGVGSNHRPKNDSWCFFYEFSQAVAKTLPTFKPPVKHSYQQGIFGSKVDSGQVVVSGVYPEAWQRGVDRIIHGTNVHSYDFSKVDVGKSTMHGSYGYRTASKLLLWFLCHVYGEHGEPLNNVFYDEIQSFDFVNRTIVFHRQKSSMSDERDVVDIVNYELKKTFLLMVLGMKSMCLEPKWPLLNDWSERAFFLEGLFRPKTQDTHRFGIIFIIYLCYLYYSIPNIFFFQGTLQGLVVFYTLHNLDDLICFQYVSMSKKHHPFLTAKKKVKSQSRPQRQSKEWIYTAGN